MIIPQRKNILSKCNRLREQRDSIIADRETEAGIFFESKEILAASVRDRSFVWYYRLDWIGFQPRI